MCDGHVTFNIVKKVLYAEASTFSEGYDILEVESRNIILPLWKFMIGWLEQDEIILMKVIELSS